MSQIWSRMKPLNVVASPGPVTEVETVSFMKYTILARFGALLVRLLFDRYAGAGTHGFETGEVETHSLNALLQGG